MVYFKGHMEYIFWSYVVYFEIISGIVSVHMGYILESYGVYFGVM